MLNDLRYTFRALAKSPGFALTAIISIALAIGANSSIFSMADGLVLRPLPIADPSEVVTLRSQTPAGIFAEMSRRDFVDFRERNRSFDALVAYRLSQVGFAVEPDSQSRLRVGFFVTSNFFVALGVEPQLGRGFRPDEDEVPGRNAVIVLSHDLWKTDLAADPSVIGRSVRLNGLEFTVVGVAPESFTGMDPYLRPAFFVPAMMGPRVQVNAPDMLTNRSNRGFTVKGRLRPNVSVQAAAEEASAIAKSLAEMYPQTNRGFGATVRTEMQARLDFNPADAIIMAVFFALVVVVLVIACANVANLLLSRGQARAREIGIRLAIGASRTRIVRQLLAESLVIALAGGTLGLFIADYAVQMSSGIQIPGDLPIAIDIRLDQRVLYFTLVASVASALFFGLIPALQSTRADPASVMKAGGVNEIRRRFVGRYALVVVQIAGSLILLVAALQQYRGISATLIGTHGFRTDHRLAMTFDPTLIGYNGARTAEFFKSLSDRANVFPGIKSATLAYSTPLTTNMSFENVIPENFELPNGQESLLVAANTVDDRFFETLSVPILLGRGFQEADGQDAPPVTVVNQEFARQFLGTSPIGKRLRLPDSNGPWLQVIGVAGNGKYITIFEPVRPFIYLPFSQHPRRRMTLIAETQGDPASMAGPLEEMVRSMDANMPVWNVRTMDDIFEQRSVKVAQLMIGVVGSVGVMGLSMALVGLYAVVAYQVSRRRREIGIRMAIGAARVQVMKLILRQAAVMAIPGVLIGAVLSFAAAPAFTMGLDMPVLGPAAMSLIAIALLATTFLAAAIPARRASKIDPQEALRQE